MFEKYTNEARRVIFFARDEAHRLGAGAIGAEHLLLGILREDARAVRLVLPEQADKDYVRRRVGETAVTPPEGAGARTELPLSQDAKQVLAYAHEESLSLSHRHIGGEHLLLGLLCVEGTLAGRVLRERGATLDGLREKVAGLAAPDLSSGGRHGQAADTSAGASYGVARPRTYEGMRVEHIGIATKSIEEALRFWRDALGLEVTHTEVVEEQGVRVAMLPVGEPRVELLEPTGPSSPVAKFMEKRGPGIHHVAVRVADIRASLARLKSSGARLIDETPRRGADNCLVAFVHPAASGGVLLELVEHPADPPDPDTERL